MIADDHDPLNAGAHPGRRAGWAVGFSALWLVVLLVSGGAPMLADETNAPALPILKLGAWTPIFQGLEHLSAQTLAGDSGNQVIHALRVDLQDPDVQFFTTAADTNAQSQGGETLGQTTSQFLRGNNLQAAVNANFFAACCGLPEAPVMYVYGLAVSRGAVVSAQETPLYAASLVITSNKVPRIIATNWPPMDTTGVYTAVTGNRPLVLAGVNVGQVGPVHPRTAIGYTQDKRHLILLTMDGRQPGYSDGSTDFDTAQWMIRLGAYDAINLDGGGSTTMAIADGRGEAIQFNRAIDSGLPGHERLCGNHFGIYAKSLPASVAGGTNSTPGHTMGIAGFVPGFNRVVVSGQAGDLYRFEYTDSLSGTNWQTLTIGPVEQQGYFDFMDTTSATLRFYRAVKLKAGGGAPAR